IEPVVSTVTPNQSQSSSVNTKAKAKVSINVKNKSSKQVELPEGVGTVLWYLCQLLLRLSSTLATTDEKEEEKERQNDLTPINTETKVVIETILSKCYDLNIPFLNETMTRYWVPPQLLKRQEEVERETKETKRKQKAAKAKAKALKNIKKQKKLFEERNRKVLIEDIGQEEKEQQDLLSSCGVGAEYPCIICRLKQNQNQMALIAFAT
ncbi:hypothetical protein RFI_26445, partial [Reticulomyxa filosa]